MDDKKLSYDTSLHLTLALVTLIRTYTKTPRLLPCSGQLDYNDAGDILNLFYHSCSLL